MTSQYAQTNRSVESFNRTVDGFRVIVSRETWGDRPGKPSRFQALVQPKGDARLAIGDIRGSICETEADAVESAFARLRQHEAAALLARTADVLEEFSARAQRDPSPLTFHAASLAGEEYRKALVAYNATKAPRASKPCAVCGGSGLGEEWDHERLDDAGRPTLKPCDSCAGA